MTKLAATGANLVRIGLQPWSYRIEMEEMGNYSDRMEETWELDQVVEFCENEDLYIYLQDEVHNMYNLVNPNNPGNPTLTWENNPYKTGNQSTIANINFPFDFFPNPLIIEQYKKKVRYLVARWGYSTNIACHEIFSEIDGVDFDFKPSFNPLEPDVDDVFHYGDEETPQFFKDNIYNWVKVMAEYMKNDLHVPQLVSASFATPDYSKIDERIFTQIPEIEISSVHAYGNNRNINIGNRFNIIHDFISGRNSFEYRH